jgi:hypothetical protein
MKISTLSAISTNVITYSQGNQYLKISAAGATSNRNKISQHFGPAPCSEVPTWRPSTPSRSWKICFLCDELEDRAENRRRHVGAGLQSSASPWRAFDDGRCNERGCHSSLVKLTWHESSGEWLFQLLFAPWYVFSTCRSWVTATCRSTPSPVSCSLHCRIMLSVRRIPDPSIVAFRRMGQLEVDFFKWTAGKAHVNQAEQTHESAIDRKMPHHCVLAEK